MVGCIEMLLSCLSMDCHSTNPASLDTTSPSHQISVSTYHPDVSQKNAVLHMQCQGVITSFNNHVGTYLTVVAVNVRVDVGLVGGAVTGGVVVVGAVVAGEVVAAGAEMVVAGGEVVGGVVVPALAANWLGAGGGGVIRGIKCEALQARWQLSHLPLKRFTSGSLPYVDQALSILAQRKTLESHSPSTRMNFTK